MYFKFLKGNQVIKETAGFRNSSFVFVKVFLQYLVTLIYAHKQLILPKNAGTWRMRTHQTCGLESTCGYVHYLYMCFLRFWTEVVVQAWYLDRAYQAWAQSGFESLVELALGLAYKATIYCKIMIHLQNIVSLPVQYRQP